ncbi:hypothetical protein ACIBSV_10395 [Embleya sp. NPDC050154]|uniref:hypothetical protein n=1 Tax=unclassified Embleya TaxID=2699296 RepID=UPI0037B5EB9B
MTGPGSRSIKRGLFHLLTTRADDQLWELAVPTVDIDLVRTALDAANHRAD